MAWKFFTSTGAEKQTPASVTNPSARMHATVNQGIASVTDTNVTFGAVDWDTDSMTGTANKFTIVHAGKYLVIFDAQWAASASGGYRYSQILRNGSRVAFSSISATLSANTVEEIPLSTIIDCAIGDVISFQATQDSGGSLNVLSLDTWAAINKIDGTVVSYVGVPGSLVGQELNYVEINGGAVNMTALSEAASVTYLTSGSITLDGSTPIIVEAFIPDVDTPAIAGQNVYAVLFEDATSKGFVRFASPAAAVMRAPMFMRRRLTPSAGAHVYTVRGWVDSGTGVFRSNSGTGGSVDMPASIRITRAA